MQLSLTVRGPGVESVSYLIAKNPNNLYERGEKGLTVRLVYPTFSSEEVQFLIYVKTDPIDLVKNSPDSFDITHYINDREFAASSIFVSSIRKALGTALNGKPAEEYSSWVQHSFEMELTFGPIVTDLSNRELEALFAPMGYTIKMEYGESFIRGKSSARFITLLGKQTLQNALKHISILIPVIDNYKHYFIDERELEKLDRYGEGWLEEHPQKALILKRSLRFQKMISQSRFYEKETKAEEKYEPPKIRLNDIRYEVIIKYIEALPQKATIVDFGAGEGKLSVQLGFIKGVQEILSVEPSNKARLKALGRFDYAKEKRGFVEPKSLAGSLFYYDERLSNKDVMVLCEVIEHIDEYRIARVFETIFKDYRPEVLIVTTPNQEYNVVYDMNEEMRHHDHRFEWTRAQLRQKVEALTKIYPYQVSYQGIGEENQQYGHPTQMVIFRREEG
ncbi:3' terminal RNA ribose 2'-O-methyltransferase Hen1 [Bacillus sp. OV166]|uniref:3' terminal RNA ribose 2'-O-methyltransferase Hen1 n=1 Tax=Bacillus sp. OV166 TaxID=1882763 RepID=UPI000A2AA8C8|nr:3' terminal RNA ribose 2'-O-methyltransferase Hen1 [Bacillus sp. OV166]SMQ81845.1 3' terminal RNA ribose 2'-O-methyltransferase Hen1 [Bacillus sp. OV166]